MPPLDEPDAQPQPQPQPQAIAGEVIAADNAPHRNYRSYGRAGLLEQRPELKEQMCALLQAGNNISASCAMLGIATSAYHEWVQRGLGKHPQLLPNPLYVDFAEAVTKARAYAEVAALERIRKVAKGGQLITTKRLTKPDGSVLEETTYTQPNWSADAWFLERSRPKAWGRRTLDINMNIKLTKPVEELTDAELLELERQLLEDNGDAPTED